MILIILSGLLILLGLGFGFVLPRLAPGGDIFWPYAAIVAIAYGVCLLVHSVSHHTVARRVKALKEYRFFTEGDAYKGGHFDFEAFLHSIGAGFIAVGKVKQGYVSCCIGSVRYVLDTCWADSLRPELKKAMQGAADDEKDAGVDKTELDDPDSTLSRSRKQAEDDGIYLVTVYSKFKRHCQPVHYFFRSSDPRIYDSENYPAIHFSAEAFRQWYNDVSAAVGVRKTF